MGVNLNAAVADKVAKVLSLLDIPWPGGDPAGLRRLAGEWRAMAGTLTGTADRLDGSVTGVVGPDWEGSAADAFTAHWKTQRDAFKASAENFQIVAQELDAYANEAESIIEQIVEIALEIAEMELAGMALTFLTAGLSDLVSTAASGVRALKIVKLVERFIELAKKGEEALTKLAEAGNKMARALKVLIDLLKAGIKNTAMNLVGTQTTNLMSGKGLIGGSDVESAALAGFGGAAAGAGLGGLGHALTSDGAHAAPSKIAQALTGDGLTGAARIGQQAGMGGVTSAFGAGFADTVQGKDGRTTIADTLTSGVTGAAGAGDVAHTAEPSGTGKHASSDPSELPVSYEIGRNGQVYGEGGLMENAANQNPGQKVGQQFQGADGAVQTPA
ncbi:WXG100 family type VII secretion target [Streptacidiphilus sp. MAP12-16]|uniref:WXG100 family type VII secretion target n=1 Tax=Streptacidiphilus sp. MAP12-16 TaxID=3156300 RepID=UPI00351249CB